MPVDYVVRIATDSQSHCARMERWLLDGHFADVIAAEEILGERP